MPSYEILKKWSEEELKHGTRTRARKLWLLYEKYKNRFWDDFWN